MPDVDMRQAEEARWGLEEGDEIAPGRHALKRLGGGHRYEAYLAWDDHLHALTVVKLVRPHLVDDPQTLDGLADEVDMLQRLSHPVLLRGFAAELEGPRPHVVLEHLEGPRLSTLIRKYGPLPVEQLVPLGLQLCSVVHYLGCEQVLHLDIKPSNIIMGAPARLIDLSIAHELDDTITSPVGTDAYMAPEQCDPTRLGPIGPAADVFGIGVTLYRAGTGERAYSPSAGADAEPERRWPQLIEPPIPLDGRLPAALAEPIMDCLEPDPSARPTPDALSSALEPLLAGLPKPRLSRLKPRLR